MRHPGALLLSSIALLACGATSLPAQQKVEFGLGTGLTLPAGDYGKAATLGAHFMAGAFFSPGGPVSARVDLGVHRTGLEPAVGSGGHSLLYGGTAGLVLSLPGVDPSTYVVANLGYHRARVKGPQGGGVSSRGSYTLGGGIGVRISTGAGPVFLEARYLHIGRGVDWTFLPVTIGMRFGTRAGR